MSQPPSLPHFWAERLEKKVCEGNALQEARLIHLGAPSVLSSAFTVWLSHPPRLILALLCWFLYHWGAGSCTNKGQFSNPGASQAPCGEQGVPWAPEAPGQLSSSQGATSREFCLAGIHNPAGTMGSSAAFSTNPPQSYFRPIILEDGLWWAVPPRDFTFSSMGKCFFYLGKLLTWLKCWSLSIKLLMSGSKPLTFSSGLLICAFSPLETTLLV